MMASNDSTSSSVSGAFIQGQFGFTDAILDFCDNIIEELGDILEEAEDWAQEDLQKRARYHFGWRKIKDSLRVDLVDGEFSYYSEEDARATELEFGRIPKSLLRTTAHKHGDKLEKRINRHLEEQSPIA